MTYLTKDELEAVYKTAEQFDAKDRNFVISHEVMHLITRKTYNT
jgi:predicted SprT family Zn-dependent metalloprotease